MKKIRYLIFEILGVGLAAFAISQLPYFDLVCVSKNIIVASEISCGFLCVIEDILYQKYCKTDDEKNSNHTEPCAYFISIIGITVNITLLLLYVFLKVSHYTMEIKKLLLLGALISVALIFIRCIKRVSGYVSIINSNKEKSGQMLSEADKRMRMIGFSKKVREDFIKDKTVLLSQSSDGEMRKLNQKEKNYVADIISKKKSEIYHVVYMQDGPSRGKYFFLNVEDDKKIWRFIKIDITHHLIPCYGYDPETDYFSDFQGILYKKTEKGGLKILSTTWESEKKTYEEESINDTS